MATIPDRTTQAWQQADNRSYLHPFSDYQELHAEGARVQVRAKGIYMWDTDGQQIIDGLAGLGCVMIGYGRPELGRAAARQMDELSFCQSFFKTTNQPAILLAEKLKAITPGAMSHVFYASSGSEANDTCMRLVWRYWQLIGKPAKRIIIARENAYHGSTIATAALSDLPPMQADGAGLDVSNIHRIKAPYWYLNGEGESHEAFGITAARWLEQAILALGAENIAAFHAEPMQGAGGAIIPPDSYWAEIQRICKQYDVLLVADEVVTGFGRTGEWFGCQSFGIAKPDLIAIAKGITSAYIPLSAAMVSDRIASVLIDQGGEFYHGFTHSGHPVACAVALENIRILEEEGIIDNAKAQSVHFAAHIAALADHPLVGDVRSRGLLAGIQLAADPEARQLFAAEEQAGPKCSAAALTHGLALRSIGDTMALMPPLIVTASDIDAIFERTRKALDDTARLLKRL
jgi:putrescine---pyruvate transaminase